MSIVISDTSRLIQYSASAGQTAFTIPFVFLADADIKAYKRGATDTPDDTADLLTITTDYTLSGAGNAAGGTLTLTSGATLNDVVTIVGDDAVGRSSFYTTDVTADALNEDFEKQTIFNRLNETLRAERMLYYQRSAVIADKDRELVTLGALEGWRKNSGNTAFEAVTVLSNVVDDTSPQLGGNLDLNSNNITGTGQWQGTEIGVAYGGTGATTASAARTNLGAQVQDAKLDAIISNATNAVLCQTGASTIVGRTLTGTSNRIDITNGDGVSGNPTFTVSSTFDFPGTATIATAPTVGNSVVNKTYADGLFTGTWLDAISGFVDFTTAEPGGPSVGDRYVNTVTGTSSGTAQSVTANYIYEWNGATWTETIPSTSDKIWDEVANKNYIYSSSGSWVQFGETDTFLALQDTPSAYTTAYSLYQVNSAADAVAESGTQLTEPGANNFTITRGTTAFDCQADLTITATCTLDQDLQQSASPTFAGATLSGLSAQGVVKNSVAGLLSTEAQLALADGGTAIDSSGATDGQLLIGGSASNDLQLATLTAGSNIDITNGTNSITVAANVSNPFNLAVGADFRVSPWSEGTSITAATTPANSDDTYVVDCWNLLSDGNDIIDITQDTDDTFLATVQTANKKFGIIQFVENARALPAIGGTVSVSVEAKGTGDVDEVRIGILAWDSTSDTVTSDVVSAWENAATNPTLVANWTYENTPSAHNLTGSFQTFKEEAVDIDTANTTNIAIFIWTNVTDASATDTLSIRRVQVEVSSSAGSFLHRSAQEEQELVARYYQKSFAAATAPAQNAGVAGAMRFTAAGGGVFAYTVPYIPRMRVSPTVTTYNPSAANSSARNLSDSTDTAINPLHASDRNHAIAPVGTDPTDADDVMTYHWVADARL